MGIHSKNELALKGTKLCSSFASWLASYLHTVLLPQYTPCEVVKSPAPGSEGSTGSPDKVFWINWLFSLVLPQGVLQLRHPVTTNAKVSEGKRVGQGLTRRILLLLK